jgi:hypothetical protein
MKSNIPLQLERLRDHVLLACENLKSADPRQVEIAHAEYEDLVDEFAAVFGDYVAPQQIEAARREHGYFLRLIELARTALK